MMQTAQMQNKLNSSFAGLKLGSKHGLVGSAMRFRASYRPSTARKNGVNVRAEKVGCMEHHAIDAATIF